MQRDIIVQVVVPLQTRAAAAGGLDPRGREDLALGGESAEGALLFSWAEIAVIDQAISRLSRRENRAWRGRYLVNYPLDAKDLAFETQEFSWLLVKSHQILSYAHTFCDCPQRSCGILIGSDIAAKALSTRLIFGLATHPPSPLCETRYATRTLVTTPPPAERKARNIATLSHAMTKLWERGRGGRGDYS